MAVDREIKKRIKSVKNIAKVTKTMQMVSAARMKKAINNWQDTYPYAEELARLVGGLGEISTDEVELMRKTAEVKTIAVVIVAPTKGFVGGLIQRQLLSVVEGLKVLRKSYPLAEIQAIGVHKLAGRLVSSCGLKAKYIFTKEVVVPNYQNLSGLYQTIKNGFCIREFDLVLLSYIKFESATRQTAVFEPLLPISETAIVGEDKNNKGEQSDNILCEPDKNKLLDYLLNEYVEKQINNAILSSNAAEHSTRMISMKNATDNANDMIADLSLKFNKSRQGLITQQVVEVSAGFANDQ